MNIHHCKNCNKKLKNIYAYRCPKCAAIWRTKKNIGNYCKSSLKQLYKTSLTSAYWIGFLTADGYIDFNTFRLKLTLGNKDISHLIKFAKYIQDSNIHYYKNSCEIQTQDKLYIPKLIKKYQFAPKKTYNPCKYHWLIKSSNNIFISFLIGLIDGDGSVHHQFHRKDFGIWLKMHKNWLNYLIYLRNRLSKITQVLIPVPYLVTQNKYSICTLTNSKIINYLKKFINHYKIPILKRKWQNVPDNYISKYTTTQINILKIQKFLEQGMKQCDIAKKLHVVDSTISNLKKRIKKTVKGEIGHVQVGGKQ